MASGTRTVKIRFDGSASGLTSAAAKARAELKALEKQADTNKKNLGKLGSGVQTLASNFGRAALQLHGLSAGVGIILSLASVLTTASGAAFLLPAALGVAVAAMITTKLGADGIKAALDRLNPTLDTLKAKVSATFQSGLAPAVTNLKTLLPQLTPGFQGIAAALSAVAVRITALEKSPQQVGALKAILAATATIIRNIGSFLAPVIAGFITLAAAAVPSLTQLTTGIGNVGDRFKAWTDQVAASGQVTAWIQNAVALFKSLWGVVQDLGGILADVFSAAEQAGGGFTGSLGVVIKTVREFLDSAQGHDTLVAVFQALNTVGQAVSKVLGAALKALVPVLPPLLDAFGQLATQAANFLVPAIQTLAPLLLNLANFLAQNLSWLGPIVLAITGLVLAIQGLVAIANIVKGAIAAWTAVQWLLNIAMDANPIGLVVIAIVALIAIIALVVSNLDFFRGIWDSVWRFCSDVITSVTSWFSSAWSGALSWVQGVASNVAGFFGNVWRGAQSVVAGIVSWFSSAWSSAVDAVAGFFGGLASRVSGAFSSVAGAVRSAINGVIRFVNGAINGVNHVTGLVGIPAIPNIPQLARGGTATSGRPYLVGERGPELFTPGRTGRVTNANTTAEAIGGGGAARVIELVLDLGQAIQERVQIQIDADNRATARALGMGAGANR